MEETIRALLTAIERRELSIDDGVARLKGLAFEDLGFANIDHHRALRRGLAEVVLAEGKTVEQCVLIVERLLAQPGNILVTRADPTCAAALVKAHTGADWNELARTVFWKRTTEAPRPEKVLVVSAGTSDLPVAEEAAVTARAFGNTVETLYDVGVAGIHRLLGQGDRFREASAIVVVAGMEGALPSVVGGLTDVPVIAVPTSVGYGASFGGLAALLGMLNSCASGVTVVNIDNGFGGGYAASLVTRVIVRGEALLRIAHFDPITGAAGDMFLGALIDAGAPVDDVRAQLLKLELPAFRFEANEVRPQGLRATHLTIEVPDEANHRHLPQIVAIIEKASLAPRVKSRALAVFERLARAEARAHGIPFEKVHFHEVGALDAIVDIVGSAVALEILGVEQVTFSALRVGTGEVDTAHGRMPVPVPAVLELTKDVPIVRTDIAGEILTPTGAALLTTWGRLAGGEAFVTEAVGVACGTRELPGRPNLLRVSIGELSTAATSWEEDRIVVLETNLDDMTPELLPTVLEEALAAGALDAFLVPVVMKKGRPGHLLTVLCEEAMAARVARVLFRETTTFGIRRSECPRWKLPRTIQEVESPWGPLGIKIGTLGEGHRRITPEYESCRAIADRTGRPLLEVYREVEEYIRSREWDVKGADR